MIDHPGGSAGSNFLHRRVFIKDAFSSGRPFEDLSSLRASDTFYPPSESDPVPPRLFFRPLHLAALDIPVMIRDRPQRGEIESPANLPFSHLSPSSPSRPCARLLVKRDRANWYCTHSRLRRRCFAPRPGSSHTFSTSGRLFGALLTRSVHPQKRPNVWMRNNRYCLVLPFFFSNL